MIRDSATLGFHIVGSDTQIGRSLGHFLSDRGIPFSESTVEDSMVEKTFKAQLGRSTNAFVVNALFEGDVDSQQKADEATQALWLGITNTLCDYINSTDFVLIHLSDALVFSGNSPRGYIETDVPNSTFPLGQLLFKVEQLIEQKCVQHIILRSSWIFSGFGNNFMIRLVDAAISHSTLQFSGNIRGCPTNANSIARVITAIAEQIDCGSAEPELWGLYHYADSDACSLHTFAKTVINSAKSMAKIEVESIVMTEANDGAESADNGENSELSCKKILSTFGVKQRPWRRGINEVLTEVLLENDSA